MFFLRPLLRKDIVEVFHKLSMFSLNPELLSNNSLWFPISWFLGTRFKGGFTQMESSLRALPPLSRSTPAKKGWHGCLLRVVVDISQLKYLPLPPLGAIFGSSPGPDPER